MSSGVKKIEIRLYGVVKDSLGWEKKEIILDKSYTLREIFERFSPEIIDYINREKEDVIIVFNGSVVPLREIDRFVIEKESEIDILPSITGGSRE